MSSYYVGGTISAKATITNEDGAAYDPATVTATLVAPGGTETEIDVVRESTGIYTAQHDPDGAGVWAIYFRADEDFDSVSRYSFRVVTSPFDAGA